MFIFSFTSVRLFIFHLISDVRLFDRVNVYHYFSYSDCKVYMCVCVCATFVFSLILFLSLVCVTTTFQLSSFCDTTHLNVCTFIYSFYSIHCSNILQYISNEYRNTFVDFLCRLTCECICLFV